jgi:hypothetical protein
MIVFQSLTEAIRQGYQVFDRTNEGYIVRTRIGNVWALALVVLR